MVQWRYNIVSDNGPVDSTLSDFVREWNEKYSSPRLIIANAGEMMQEFEEKFGKSIPTWSGDFTPYWEDGAYSTAKEEGEVRPSAQLTNPIEAAKILIKPIDPRLLYRAKRSIEMWHEHTWGAWCSISSRKSWIVRCAQHPLTSDGSLQWRVKQDFADNTPVDSMAIKHRGGPGKVRYRRLTDDQKGFTRTQHERLCTDGHVRELLSTAWTLQPMGRPWPTRAFHLLLARRRSSDSITIIAAANRTIR